MTIRVLVFDDDPSVRVTLARWMDHERDMELVGYAEDGDQAVVMAIREPADVIVMDVMMPGLSGIQATEAIRQRGIDTPIVMLTADDSAEKAVSLLRNATFVSKGRSGPKETVAAIRTAAGGWKEKPLPGRS